MQACVTTTASQEVSVVAPVHIPPYWFLVDRRIRKRYENAVREKH
jgi:hypothetical protein